MIWWQALLKPIDLERKVLPPINTANPESVSLLYETSFVFLFNNFSNSAVWNFLNPALVCGRVWIFPAHSNECFGTGDCSRHGTASIPFQAQLQHASCCTPVLMQLALLCVCATVRRHRQSDRRVLKRPGRLSVLCYILKINHVPYIRLFSLKKALPKILTHTQKHSVPLQCFGWHRRTYPNQLKTGPPWQGTGQKEAGMDAACSLPQKAKSLSAAFRRSLNSLSVFNIHTTFLFSPEAGLLEQHRQYKTLLLCLFCDYPMNALTF